METNIWRGSTCWIWRITLYKGGERLLGGDFHLGHGKRNFAKGKRSLKMPYGFWNDSLPLSTFSLTMALVQIHSPKPSLIFGSWFVSNPASWTSPYNYFHLSLIKNNLCLLSWSLEVFKGATLSALSFVSKPISLASPLNPQPRSMKIHWSSVQNFQTILATSLDQICQIWWNSFKSFSKNSEKNQAASGCIERSPHQVPAPGKIFSLPNHSVEHLQSIVTVMFRVQ